MNRVLFVSWVDDANFDIFIRLSAYLYNSLIGIIFGKHDIKLISASHNHRNTRTMTAIQDSTISVSRHFDGITASGTGMRDHLIIDHCTEFCSLSLVKLKGMYSPACNDIGIEFNQWPTMRLRLRALWQNICWFLFDSSSGLRIVKISLSRWHRAVDASSKDHVQSTLPNLRCLIFVYRCLLAL